MQERAADITEHQKPNNLKLHRLNARLSQVRLARQTGCSIRTISRIEQGYEPSIQIKTRLAQELGLPISDIFPDTREVPGTVVAFKPEEKHQGLQWLEKSIVQPPIPGDFSLETSPLLPEFEKDGSSIPALEHLHENFAKGGGSVTPVICGTQGSGKTSTSLLFAKQLADQEGCSPLYIPAELLQGEGDIFEEILSFMSIAYPVDARRYLENEIQVVLILDGIEALLSRWQPQHFLGELIALQRKVLSANFSQHRVKLLLTCNTVTATMYLARVPSLELMFLRNYSHEDGMLPEPLKKWWSKILPKSPVVIETVESEDMGNLHHIILGNAYLAREIIGDNEMMTPVLFEDFYFFLYSRAWKQTPSLRALNRDDFMLLGRSLPSLNG